jgi:RNA polymerase sigma factor (sigma-70 family)
MTDHERPAGVLREFPDWYAVAYPRVRAAMALAAGDPGLGEEAAAEAFARALAHWSRVGRMEAPEGWVYTVALNELRRGWRRARLERRWLAHHPPDAVVPAPEVDDALWTAVATLPPRARTAIALRYVADLTEPEVAAAMGIARGTVAATLSVARRRLAVVLTDQTVTGRTTEESS